MTPEEKDKFISEFKQGLWKITSTTGAYLTEDGTKNGRVYGQYQLTIDANYHQIKTLILSGSFGSAMDIGVNLLYGKLSTDYKFDKYNVGDYLTASSNELILFKDIFTSHAEFIKLFLEG